MLSKAVNGYTATQIDRVLYGEYGPFQVRVRGVLYDRFGNQLHDITSLILTGSQVLHNSLSDVKRAANLIFRETDRDLGDYADIVIADGPSFYLRYGESSGATAADSSGNSRDFAIINFSAGDYARQSLLNGALTNTAFNFDGSNNQVTKAHASWMNVTHFSYEAWVKSSSTSGFQMIMSRDNGTTQRQFQFRLDQTTGYLAFHGFFPSLKSFVTTVSLTDGLPHHVVATYDGSFVRLYADGARILSTAETGAYAAPTLEFAGGSQFGGGNVFNGQLDEMAMYDRALTPSEIREHYQAGSGVLDEILFERGDRIQIYYAIKTPWVGTDGSVYAEWPLIYGVLSSPNRRATPQGIIREAVAYDQLSVLKNAKFSNRHTVAAGVNYVTGTNAILAIIQSVSGLDTTGWAITATTATLAIAVDFKIGESKLEAVNYLLDSCGYKPLRFRGDGKGVIEPKALPATRPVEDTLLTDANSVVAAADVDEGTELDKVFNVVTLYRDNPELTFLTSTQTNTKISSPTSTVFLPPNEYVESFEAADQTALDTAAKEKLESFSQINKRVRVPTPPRPYHDNEDKITLRHTGFEFALETEVDAIEEEWTLPLDGGAMQHVERAIANVVS